MERRRHPRVNVPFSVRVRGVDAGGKPFKAETLLENLSAGGLYMRLGRDVEAGSKLLVVVSLAAGNIAAQGPVVRVESKPDGSVGVAVKFLKHRFL